MQVLPYEPTMLPKVTAAYNHIIQNVPHCYPTTEARFGDAIAGVIGEGDKESRLHSEAAYVAMEADALLGFIHVGIGKIWGSQAERGIIHFFWYERGQRAAGQALLDAAEAYLRQQDVERITAFSQQYRYRFYYLPAAYLSDHLDHLHALLQFNGYKKSEGEVFLNWPNYDVQPVPTEVPMDVSVALKPERGKLPGLIVSAKQEGQKVGVCESICAGGISQTEAAQHWLFTTWLGVEEAFQGKGVGRYLLQRCLVEMRKIGYRNAAISTAWDNYRAFVFYSNCGYHVVDWTYGLTRDLMEG